MRRYWLFILVMLFRGSAGVEVPASEKIHLSAQIRKGMNLPDASARFLIIGFSLTKESPPRVSA